MSCPCRKSMTSTWSSTLTCILGISFQHLVVLDFYFGKNSFVLTCLVQSSNMQSLLANLFWQVEANLILIISHYLSACHKILSTTKWLQKLYNFTDNFGSMEDWLFIRLWVNRTTLHVQHFKYGTVHKLWE